MCKKISFFILTLLLWVSCHNTKELNINGQTKFEANVNTAQSNTNDSPSETSSKTFAKTFVVKGRFDESKGKIVDYENLVEFKDTDSTGVSIYVDGKKKASLKFDVSNPKVRADFLETNGDHLFVIVIRSLATGTCGDAVFAIVKIDNKLNVNLSNLNKPDCQGEMYPVKIENIKIDKPKEYFRQISIGNFKFNLESFEWINKD